MTHRLLEVMVNSPQISSVSSSMTVNIFVLLKANIDLFVEYGLMVIGDGALEQLVDLLGSAYLSMGKDLHVTVSIGYSPLLLPPDNVALGWERVLGLADKALYMPRTSICSST